MLIHNSDQMPQYQSYEEYHETRILEENPYNPLKHFLFELPTVCAFVLKVSLAFALVYLLTASLIATAVMVSLEARGFSVSNIKEIEIHDTASTMIDGFITQ